MIRVLHRFRFDPPRAATPAASTTATATAPLAATLATLAALAVFTTTSATPASTAASTAATLAAFLSPCAGARGLTADHGRFRRHGHHVAAGTEIGIDFNDADLWNFGEPTAGTGAAT